MGARPSCAPHPRAMRSVLDLGLALGLRAAGDFVREGGTDSQAPGEAAGPRPRCVRSPACETPQRCAPWRRGGTGERYCAVGRREGKVQRKLERESAAHWVAVVIAYRFPGRQTFGGPGQFDRQRTPFWLPFLLALLAIVNSGILLARRNIFVMRGEDGIPRMFWVSFCHCSFLRFLIKLHFCFRFPHKRGRSGTRELNQSS